MPIFIVYFENHIVKRTTHTLCARVLKYCSALLFAGIRCENRKIIQFKVAIVKCMDMMNAIVTQILYVLFAHKKITSPSSSYPNRGFYLQIKDKVNNKNSAQRARSQKISSSGRFSVEQNYLTSPVIRHETTVRVRNSTSVHVNTAMNEARKQSFASVLAGNVA